MTEDQQNTNILKNKAIYISNLAYPFSLWISEFINSPWNSHGTVVPKPRVSKIPLFPCLRSGQLLSQPGIFPDLFPSTVTQTALLTWKTRGNKQLGTGEGGNKAQLKASELLNSIQAFRQHRFTRSYRTKHQCYEKY